MKPWLDWASLPKLLDWKTNQSDLQLDIMVAAVFSQRYTLRVAKLYMWEAQCEAVAWLHEVANVDWGLACLVD